MGVGAWAGGGVLALGQGSVVDGYQVWGARQEGQGRAWRRTRGRRAKGRDRGPGVDRSPQGGALIGAGGAGQHMAADGRG